MAKRLAEYTKKCKWILLLLAIALIALGFQYPPLGQLGIGLLFGLIGL